jgi:hypothetical protein
MQEEEHLQAPIQGLYGIGCDKKKLNMKKFVLLLVGCSIIQGYAQTGIGTSAPHTSAKLEVAATDKGFLPPRVALTGIYDTSTIPSPATGLLVYCTGTGGLTSGYYFWNGTAWATIATAGGSGSFSASFLRGSRTASQTIAVGGAVTFSTIDQSAGSDISLNTSTGRITLAAGNTYRLRGAVPNFSAGQRPAFIWFNETTGANIGSASFSYNPGDAAALGAFGTTAELVFTPNVTTVVSLRLLSSLGSGNVTVGGNGDFSVTGSYPWFDVQVISGNAPVTGQSVDYVQASLSANQSLSSAGNINFTVSSGAGITLTGGGFNLQANKTYKLEAALGGSSGGFAYYGWVDSANTLLPGGSIGVIMKAGSAYSDAPQDKAVVIFTPTANTTVFLRVLNVSSGVVAFAPPAANNFSSTWATIQQIGSSAIVNPWVLAGNNVYNTSGNVGIGNTNPNSKLDVRTSPTSTSDPGSGSIGIGTSSATASSAGAGALRYTTSGGRLEVSDGSSWKATHGPIFAQFQGNTPQSITSVGTRVNFSNTVINVGGITITANNTITLPAGRIYRVDFNVGWVNINGGWARFAIFNSGNIASVGAHLEAVNNGFAGNATGMTTTFINTTAGSTTIDVRYVSPSPVNITIGDSGNNTSYPYIVIQAVD